MRHCRHLLTLLLIISGFSLFAYGQEQNTIRVMSYNIRYNNPNDGVNAWPNRKDRVAELIGQRYQPDITGLQETLKDQLDDLTQRLPEYASIGVGRDDGKTQGEYSPILYKNKRFKALKSGTFWLSETPETPGKKGWDAACNRIVTWAQFKDKNTESVFYFFNTHFDHRGKTAKRESAKLLWRRVSSIAGENPVVITGDFNSRETSTPYAILTGKEPVDNTISDLKDCRYLSESGHEGPTSTHTSWKEIGKPETKIDYIFVRNIKSVLNHKVLTDKFGEYFPSDHLPVLADLCLEDKQ